MNPMLHDELVAILTESSRPTAVAAVDYEPVDISPRAIAMRSIIRIADSYGWRSAITHYLETRGTSHLSDLTQPQLYDLLDRMHGYVDAAEMGASLPDCLPAC